MLQARLPHTTSEAPHTLSVAVINIFKFIFLVRIPYYICIDNIVVHINTRKND